MEIVIFGGGGFIGCHLTRRLIDEGNEVVVVDIADDKLGTLLENPAIEFVEADIRNSDNDDLCRRLVDTCDVVFDLIAYANPQQYMDIPLEVVRLNLFENLKIVDYCEKTDTRLIQFSTCEVYGMIGNRDEEVFHEDESNLILGPVGNQRWIYSVAKQLLERMVYAHGEQNDLDYTIVRPFNFVGPRMDYIVESPDEGTPRVFAAFMSALLYNHEMTVVDGGTNRRSFTYIQDAIDAIVLILENEEGRFSQEIVNVGAPDNETTIRELAELMRNLYRELVDDATLPPIEVEDGTEFYGEGYEDCERRVPDVRKLESAGWEPQYTLREAFKETMRHYIDTSTVGRPPSAPVNSE